MNTIKTLFIITVLFASSVTYAATATWNLNIPSEYTVSDPSDITVANGVASLVSQFGGLSLLGTYDTLGYAMNLSLSPDGNTAYVSTETEGLDILDVSDPTNPMLVHNLEADFSNVASAISPDGNTAYLANSFYGLQIVDITDPLNPTVLTTYRPNPGYTRGITLSDDLTTAYLGVNARGGAVQIVDITNPTNIVVLGSYVNGIGAEEMILSADGNTLFAAAGHDGLLILDVSDPTNPTALSNYYPNGSSTHLAVTSDEQTVYLPAGEQGLHIVDVSDPLNPTLIAEYTTGFAYVTDVKLSSDDATAYVADNQNGFHVLDVSDPLNVTITDTYDTTGYAESVTVSSDESIAYVTDADDGVALISLTGLPFASTNPYVSPVNSQSFTGTLSGFKGQKGAHHEGQLRYQVSTDNGATWYFFKVGTGTWEQTTRTDGTQVSTAKRIRQNLATLDTDGGDFTWRAYLKSDGTQPAELDWVKVKF